jgi:hypothetical protein
VSQRFLRAPFHCGDGGVIGKEDDGIKTSKKKYSQKEHSLVLLADGFLEVVSMKSTMR